MFWLNFYSKSFFFPGANSLANIATKKPIVHFIAKLLWDISDNTELLLGFDYSTDDNNGLCRDLTKLDNPPEDHNAGGAFVPTLQQIKIDNNSEDPRTCAMTLEQYAERDVFGLSARLQMEFANNLSLTSITAYRELEYSWLQELGGMDSPPNLLSVEDNEGDDADQISQEFRLTYDGDRLFWVAGAYYFKENVDRFANVPIFFGPGSPVAPGAFWIGPGYRARPIPVWRCLDRSFGP